jgi:hypothetical protein
MYAYFNYIFQAEENLGTVMIFTLVSSAQEWLNTKWDEIRKAREEYAILKEKEAEEAERVCLFGVNTVFRRNALEKYSTGTFIFKCMLRKAIG